MISNGKKFDEKDHLVIRKLGFFESMMDEELMKNNMTITTSTVFLVNKEIEIDIASLRKALFIWIKIHKLLQATTYRFCDQKTKKPRIDLPKYFVTMEKNIEDYNNFEFIENSANTKDYISLTESELKTPLDFINGPLWRMKFLKINENMESDKTKYALVLTISHSISDGRNSFSIITQFLNILDKVLRGKFLDQDEQNEIISKNQWEKIIKNMKSEKKVKIKKDDFDFLSTLTHRIPENVGNNLEGVNGRIVHFIINEEKMSKIIKSIKSNKPTAKLTSFFILIICLAFRRACIVHNVKDIPLDSFNIGVPVCIRKKLDVNNLQMGAYVGFLEKLIFLNGPHEENSIKKRLWYFINRFCYFIMINIFFPVYFFFVRIFKNKVFLPFKNTKLNQNDDLSNFEANSFGLNENFWSIVGDISAKLHKNISDNFELEIAMKELFKMMIKNNFDFSNFSPVNFSVSNLGKMENLKFDSGIKVVESYVCLPCNF